MTIFLYLVLLLYVAASAFMVLTILMQEGKGGGLSGLGGRAIVRISRVARTVADTHEHELVDRDDLAEALSFRSRSAT